MDEHCRITIVGERQTVDLAVPADAPIAAYVSTLAKICGQRQNDVLPPAWSLAPVVGGPFPPERSLGQLGVLDGTVLYLRDVVADEYADPVVHDVADRVAEVAETALGRGWNDRVRAVTALVIGIAWLLAAFVVLFARHQIGRSVLADAAGTAGLLLPAFGWTAVDRGWSLPRRLPEALALSAVPLGALAVVAGDTTRVLERFGGVPGGFDPSRPAVVALVVGALVGATVGYAAVPGAGTCAVLLAAMSAAALGAVLVLAKAGAVASATLVAVAAFAVLTVAPTLVGRIVVRAEGRAGARETADAGRDPVAEAAGTAAGLLVACAGFLAAVIGTALVPMAASRSGYAVGAAATIGIALLVRAGAARLVAELVPLLLAGGLGLFTLLLTGPGHLHWPGWISPLGILLLASVLIAYGLMCLIRPPGALAEPRHGSLTRFSSMLGGTGVVLAVAAFGVFGWIVRLGHHL